MAKFSYLLYALKVVICILLSGCTIKPPHQTSLRPISTVIYTVEQKNANPRQLLLSANTAQSGTFQVEPPRQAFGAEPSSPPTLFCYTSGAKVAYNTDTVCDRIIWTINLESEPATGVPIPEQNSYYSPAGWALLSEYNTLPRIKMDGQYPMIQVCPRQRQCIELAATDEAPTFLIWGAHEKKIATENVVMTLVSDNSKLFSLGLHKVLFRSIGKMVDVFSSVESEGAGEKSWRIIWLKKDKSSGSIGGAAGKGVFLANYPVDSSDKNGTLSIVAQSRLHRISVHESIHLLSPYQLPLWINESLAEYYAWKMTTAAGLPTKSPENQLQAMKTRYPHANTGLYAAQRKVADAGDMSYYPLFYVKGAAFWQQLDQQLAEHDSSLNDFIVELNHAQTELPVPFVHKMKRLIGNAAWQKLQETYL